ncbi:MAG: DUF4870 domain-containing protein [Thermoanaerobaculaceae bacterium]|nr:DUF4870 domain-containing protein [Thermoanaerobaculaceae bacterium]MDI9621704.1 hypothetical protein [Acidobacteriota bacterium]NLH11485.1 DUF4870 domain-containing protein [Holophagae bacterium]
MQETPGGPPTYTPPPPPPPPTAPPPASGGPVSSNRNVMIVLAYLWLLALVPLLTEKEDQEVQWHAKHGLVLLVAEVLAWVVYFVLSMIPGVGCVIMVLAPVIWLIFVVLRIICIVKGVKGQRQLIPGLSDFVAKI